jgi:hypothetical protein
VAEGSVLDGATNVRVPVAGHFRILNARETLLAVRDGIALLVAAAEADADLEAETETA